MMAKLEETVWGTETVTFPLSLASLDIGSNAIRYTMAEFSALDRYRELETLRFPVRLGHDAFTTGTLSATALDAAVGTAVRFRQRLDDLGIEHYRAVATSAVRESRNGAQLVSRIRQESGIHLETITGSEEARLVAVAVRKRVDLGGRLWLLADLGGGSVEVSLLGGGGIVAGETHPLGTVRLLEEISENADNPDEFIHLLERYAARLELPATPEEPLAGTIITGGNAECLADLIGGRANREGINEFSVADLKETRKKLSGMTVQQRIRRLGLREDRADVILPAAIVFERVTRLAESDRILVPRVGVKEGLLYDLVADFVEHTAHEGELDRLSVAGALALGRRYRFAEGHAVQVRELALSLFDQLQWLHELGEASRRRLSAAALLHDIGQFISARKHHKHSWYIIAHSEIPGLSPEDIERVALITRYHRRSDPKDDHEGYQDLEAEGKQEVQKLAALLRVADALDREHQEHVRKVLATKREGKIVLSLETADDLSLEHWAFEKKSPLFERVFGLKLTLN